mgnify:CR=1 FL=1
MPADESPRSLNLWARGLIDRLRGGRHVEIVKGSFTISAVSVTNTTVPDTNVLADSVISVIPTNAAARTISPVAVITKSNGVGFTMRTGTTAGGETFDYVIHR